jgi:hypothetical protein
MVHHSLRDQLTARIIHYWKEFYGDNAKTSKDFGRIIN